MFKKARERAKARAERDAYNESIETDADPDRPILVYSTHDIPGTTYKPLGLVLAEEHTFKHVIKDQLSTGAAKIIRELQEQTRNLGGDAILGFQFNTIISPDKDNWVTATGFGTAIAFIEDEESN